MAARSAFESKLDTRRGPHQSQIGERPNPAETSIDLSASQDLQPKQPVPAQLVIKQSTDDSHPSNIHETGSPFSTNLNQQSQLQFHNDASRQNLKDEITRLTDELNSLLEMHIHLTKTKNEEIHQEIEQT